MANGHCPTLEARLDRISEQVGACLTEVLSWRKKESLGWVRVARTERLCQSGAEGGQGEDHGHAEANAKQDWLPVKRGIKEEFILAACCGFPSPRRVPPVRRPTHMSLSRVWIGLKVEVLAQAYAG